MIALALFCATCFLAYSNGANDNFKGVASLFGCKAASYRTAIAWATVTTFAGSITAIFLAQSLLKKFSGKGLVPDAIVGSAPFLLAVVIGAALTVILATRFGFPISTTHGVMGALIGGGLVAVGNGVNFASLGQGFVLPLLLSPVLAILLGGLLYFILRGARLALGIKKEWCICVDCEERVVAQPQPDSILRMQTAPALPRLTVDEMENCRERYAGSMLGLGSQQIMDGAHFFSAGVVSFARGLNDTPKIVAHASSPAGARFALGIFRRRGHNGDRRSSPLATDRGNDEPQNHRDESRPGILRQSRHRHSCHRRQSLWLASLHDPRLGRIALRHRARHRPGRHAGHAQHCPFLDHHAAVCCAAQRGGVCSAVSPMNLTTDNTFSRKLAG